MRHHLSIKQREQGKALSYDLGTSLAKLHSISFKEAGLFGKGLCIDTLFEEG